MDINEHLLQWFIFFDKKNSGGAVKIEVMPNQEELHKPIIRKLEKRKVYSSFKDNIWGADLTDMPLLSKFNKGFRFLLCVIDIFSKYAWVVPLKDKKGITIAKAFQEILDASGRKPNKMSVDKGIEACWCKVNHIIDFNKENNKQDPKFTVGDHVRISKFKNIFAKGYFQIKVKKFLWLRKLKTLFCEYKVLVILKLKKLCYVLLLVKNNVIKKTEYDKLVKKLMPLMLVDLFKK